MPTTVEPLLWEALHSFQSCGADIDALLEELLDDNAEIDSALQGHAVTDRPSDSSHGHHTPFAVQSFSSNPELSSKPTQSAFSGLLRVAASADAVAAHSTQGVSTVQGQVTGPRSSSFEIQHSVSPAKLVHRSSSLRPPSFVAHAWHQTQSLQQPGGLSFSSAATSSLGLNQLDLSGNQQLPLEAAASVQQQPAQLQLAVTGTSSCNQLSPAAAGSSSTAAVIATAVQPQRGISPTSTSAAAAATPGLPAAVFAGLVVNPAAAAAGAYLPAVAGPTQVVPAPAAASAAPAAFRPCARMIAGDVPLAPPPFLTLEKPRLSSAYSGGTAGHSSEVRPSGIVMALNASLHAVQQRGMKASRKPKKIIELENVVSKAACVNQTLRVQVQDLQVEWQEAAARLRDLSEKLTDVIASNSRLRKDSEEVRKSIAATQRILLQRHQAQQVQQQQ